MDLATCNIESEVPSLNVSTRHLPSDKSDSKRVELHYTRYAVSSPICLQPSKHLAPARRRSTASESDARPGRAGPHRTARTARTTADPLQIRLSQFRQRLDEMRCVGFDATKGHACLYHLHMSESECRNVVSSTYTSPGTGWAGYRICQSASAPQTRSRRAVILSFDLRPSSGEQVQSISLRLESMVGWAGQLEYGGLQALTPTSSRSSSLGAKKQNAPTADKMRWDTVTVAVAVAAHHSTAQRSTAHNRAPAEASSTSQEVAIYPTELQATSCGSASPSLRRRKVSSVIKVASGASPVFLGANQAGLAVAGTLRAWEPIGPDSQWLQDACDTRQ
ncbi:hypothetical protein CSOJ01_04930 [Colletotrichum sojae]|uniref:Uncharacterized protein n=1 Tax=Colletotrichum sojae TaxID=2175907 RepID=A0A8H6JGJ9_9PEZI|nr:hypothetical protein CSOJ01_04930 [Colletotrichum sojae]